MTDDVDIRRVSEGASLDDAHAIRRAVFIEEQGVPESIEMDDQDAASRHFVAYDGTPPVGTARLRVGDDGVAKAERVAVLAAHRGRGIGQALMAAVEDGAREAGADEMTLHAQTAVGTFYCDLGYEPTSDVFEEAGIPHVEMAKSLTDD